MPAYDSADARTALITAYFSRFPYPQAGARYPHPSSPSPPLRHYDANAPHRRIKKKTGRKNTLSSEHSDDGNRFATKGRTIYNAHRDPHSVTSIRTKPPSRSSAWQGRSPYITGISVQNTSASPLAKLQKIDAEEEWRKNHCYQFLMAASGDMGSRDWNAAGSDSSEEVGMSGPIWETPRGKDGSRDSTPSSSLSSGSDSECQWGRNYTPCGWYAGMVCMDDMEAQEMFDLYIKAEECEGPRF
ncbi:hypothetical protein BU15DRAFT_59371 [Melanogaster broomeanus]|nr:hypothetical protein BU15DRAFT_59371 [Melanogaster broomeanus]